MPVHPLIQRLIDTTSGAVVRPDDVEAFEALPGEAVLFFGGDPVRFPEALDVAVVLPELHASFGQRFRIGVVPRDVEDALAARYSVQRWPSLVFLCDGGYLGTLSGMKDWDVYRREVQQLLAATPAPRPRPVIAIRSADTAQCH